MNKKIGFRIKEIRQSHNKTMEEFGKIFNPPASKGVVSNWENDYNYPNDKRLIKIAKLGNVSVEELLGSNPLEQYTTNQLVEELNRRGYDRKEI